MTEEIKVKRKRRWFGYLLKALLVLLLILGIFILLLQFGTVQNWVGDRVTSYLSKQTGSNVSLGEVDFSVSKGVKLDQFMLESLEGDTIIAAKSLNVGLVKSLTSYFSGELDFSAITLESPDIRITTKKGDYASNIAEIVKKLSGTHDEEKPKGAPTKINLAEVSVTDLNLLIVDENANTRQSFKVEEVYISVDKFLDEGKLFLNELSLTKPIIRLRKLGEEFTLEDQSGIVEAVRDSLDESNSTWVKIAALNISEGTFSLDDDNKDVSSEKDILDYAHFEFRDINVDVDSFQFREGPDITLKLQNLSFLDDKGLQVEQLKAENVAVNQQTISLADFELKTERSILRRDLAFKFSDFDDFADLAKKVRIEASFVQSRIYLGDLMHFVAGLHSSPFFKENKYRVISLAGLISGPIDRLSGKNVDISVGEEMVIKANFSTRNLTQRDRELINFGIKELNTDIAFLRDFIPGFNLPENFDKLNDINFKGRFDGYLADFVAYGSLSTDMGDAFLDLRLDTKEGIERASYSGDLSLEDFNLRRWSGNDDLGMVNFSTSIEDGRGLTLSSVNTELNAIIESITYKGYEYRDFVMDGKLSQNQFDGEFSITDDNIDLIFDGKVELIDSVPHLDFKANIEKIDLEQLYLSEKPFSVKGNVDINGEGNNINNLLGNALASDLVISTNDTTYILDTLSLSSTKAARSNTIKFYSDVGQFDIDGSYDLKYLIPSFKKLLKQNYPQFTQNWSVDDQQYLVDQDIAFNLNISDTRNLLELAGVSDLRVKNLVGNGSLDTRSNILKFDGEVPYVGYANNIFSNTSLHLASNGTQGDIAIRVDSTLWSGKKYNPIDITSKTAGDTVNIFIGTSELADSLEKLEIGAQMIPHPKGYSVQLDNKDIIMLGEKWSFSKDNEVVFGKEYLSIDNLRLSDGNRIVSISDIDERGIKAVLDNFDFKTLNGSVINYRPMYFAGVGSLDLEIDDLFTKDKSVSVNIDVPDFTINGDSFGEFLVEAEKKPKKPFDAYIHIGTDSQGLFVEGTFDPDRDNYIDAEVRAEDFDMGIFEYILSTGIRDVEGKIDLRGNVDGPVSDIDVDAEAIMKEAGLTVVYTGVHYTFDQQIITCTERLIDFTGAELTDANGNKGVITGGIYHDHFTDFGLNANLAGDDVIAVNTTKEDNDFYYGYAKGAVSVDFNGPFDQIDMKIECTTKQGTVINIPISDGQKAGDQNFIEFIDKEELFKSIKDDVADFKIEGMGIEIDLELTEDAQVNLIFDESRGDIIQGSGNGDLKIYITRYNDFEMYGNYEIAQGDYLFTAWGIVAKPFNVRRGSQIRWTGDPINAELEIKADYSVRTPMRVFLSEFLISGSQAASDANTRTEVDLVLDLGGTLYKPTINFDLDFPNITGELASVTDNKMRSLRNNQSELNNQVLGLIVFNTFFPTGGAGSTAGADLGAAGVSTLSEFLSSQLSIVFTGLINDALAEDGLISGIDFEIGLNKNAFNGISANNNDILPDEIEVNLKNRFRFLDERLSLGLGGNYVRQSVLATNNNYFVGDFVIEYFLSSDRKLKLKVYGKYDYDENFINSSRRQKYGVGIGYRTEFGSLTDFKESFKSQIEEDLER